MSNTKEENENAGLAAFQREVKACFTLGWPIMGAQLLWLSMVVVDNMMVARLGPEPLAALALASGLFGFFNIAAIGLLSAMSPLISQAFGANREQDVGRLIRQGMRLSLVLAVFVIVGFQFAEPLFIALKQEPALAPVAQEYLQAICWGVPANLAYMGLRQFTEGTSDARPSVVIAAIAAVLNIGLDYVFIHGWGPIPAFGVKGAGYATSLIGWFMFLAMLVYIWRRPRYKIYGLFAGPYKTDWATMKEIVRLGLPISATMISEYAFFLVATFLVGTLGASTLAAHQIALNAASLTFMIPLGLSSAVAIRVAQAVGRNDGAGAGRAGYAGASLGVGLAILTATVFFTAPELVARAYSADPDMIAAAAGLMIIAGIFQVFDALQVIGMGMLRGFRDTKLPFINTLIGFWLLGFPAALLFAFQLEMGAKGVWYGLVVGLGAAALTHQVRFYRVAQKARRDMPPGSVKEATV